MLARLCSYPQLGQDTVIPAGKDSVDFHVCLESESTDDWEVDIWHNSSSESNWTALTLDSEPEENIWSLSGPDASQAKYTSWFTGTLKGTRDRPVSFTVRFRVRSTQGTTEWKWVNEHSGARDGRLIYQARLNKSSADNLSNYIHLPDGPEKWSTKLVQSEVPNTEVWEIWTEIAAAKGDASCWSHTMLGFPRRVARWMGLVQHDRAWIGPRHGRTAQLAKKDSMLYSFLREDGIHVLLLAVSGIGDVTTMFEKNKNILQVAARNDSEQPGTVRLINVFGYDFDSALCAALYHARKLVSQHLSDLSPGVYTPKPAKEDKDSGAHSGSTLEWTDLLTYNTWNGIGPQVTETKILDVLKSLDEHGIRIGNFIVDDIWQSLDHPEKEQHARGWTDFEADSKAFPGGLAAIVQKIRQSYPYIPYIGVWHALLGYWGGISPTGSIARNYSTKQVHKKPGVRPPPNIHVVYDEPAIMLMYSDFYNFLINAGVNCVKTDVQCMIDEVDTAPARRRLYSTYYKIWQNAHENYLASMAISCMSQTPYCMFRNQLLPGKRKIPVRNSNDYYPQVEDGHRWHVFANASNAILTQHLNVLPDWDMFQTKHAWGGFHGAARCLSGGLISITDPAGSHDVDLIKAMTAETCQGRTITLRPSIPGSNVHPYVGIDEQRIIQIGAFDGMAGTGTSFMGVFNGTKRDLRDFIHFEDFRGILPKQAYIVRSFRSGSQRTFAVKAGNRLVLSCHLGERDWDVYSARPVITVELEEPKGRVVRAANLGLLDKITGQAAIISTLLNVELGRRAKLEIGLRALGTLGVWIEGLDKIKIEETMVTMLGRPVPISCVTKSSKDPNTMLIDVLRAWKEGNLDNGWSNDVKVDVLWNL